jgi:hypothetical protein
MNTFANSTRRIGREIAITTETTSNPLTGAARRLAAWWSDDAVTSSFSAERERDQRMLRRQTGRS